MKKKQLAHLIHNQSHDLFWMIDADFRLIYANNTYLILIRTVTGMEHKLNEPVLLEGLGKGNTEKWKSYYKRPSKEQMLLNSFIPAMLKKR